MKPFNLEAAKAGKHLVSSLGTPCTFVAHVPAAKPNDRLVVLVDGEIYTCDESGGDTAPKYGSSPYYDWRVGMATEKHVRYISAYALWGKCAAPADTLERLQRRGHETADRCRVCSACQHSGMTDAENPTLRIEWQE